MRVLIVAFACLFINLKSDACECLQSQRQTVEQAFEKSNSVFLGKVTDTRIERGRNGFQDRFISFQLQKVYKGITAELKTITIISHAPGNSCEFGFTYGKEYLFYGVLGSSGELSYDFCGRTSIKESALEDLKYLDKLFSKQ